MPTAETGSPVSPTGDQKTCFVISPIGPDDSEVRTTADKTLRHIIEPALSAAGYTCVRADGISEPGHIPSQVIQRIIDDDLVVADLSGHNPNVFYELAIRHAIRKPFVQMIRVGEQIPFDVAANRTVSFDLQDLDSVATAKSEIIRQIEAIDNGLLDVDSPVSVAVDLQALRRSGNPIEETNAEILETLAELRADVRRLGPRAQPPSVTRDFSALRHRIEQLAEEDVLTRSQLEALPDPTTSPQLDRWVHRVIKSTFEVKLPDVATEDEDLF